PGTTTTTPASTPHSHPKKGLMVSTPESATTAVPSPHKHHHTPCPPTKTKDEVDKDNKDKDRSLQQCLTEQHTRYQKEIERIKQQCIKIYRQSLEDVRADMKFKIGQRRGDPQRRRASSTAIAATTATTTLSSCATATAR
ncbi:hypothetical protein BGX29_001785, partial [Mortierella sp. GBA35]